MSPDATTRLAVGVGAVGCTLSLLAGLPSSLETGVATPLPWVLASAEARPEKMACPDNIEDSQKIRRMMERGFESAFTQQIGQLYKVYIGNAPTVEKQREYTKKGMENAIAAYRIGISAIEGWEC